MGVFNINITANVIDEQNILGETVLQGDLVYLHSNGKYYRTSALSVSTCSTEVRMSLQDGILDDVVQMLTYGYYTFVDGTIFIPGSKLYISTVNGKISSQLYSNPLYVNRYIGTAYDSTTILFNPDQTYIHDGGTKINGVSIQAANGVDEVQEYADLASFPAIGESQIIYIALDTNKVYRWSGTQYTEISSSLVLGETSLTAYQGDKGKVAYDHSQSVHAPSNAEQNVQSDWVVPSGDAHILNKPTNLSDFNDDLNITGIDNWISDSFDADWTLGTGWTDDINKKVGTAATGTIVYNNGILSVISGIKYVYEITVSNYSLGSLGVKVGNGALNSIEISQNGLFRIVSETIGTSNDMITISVISAFTGEITVVKHVDSYVIDQSGGSGAISEPTAITWAELLALGSWGALTQYNITDAHPITGIIYGKIQINSGHTPNTFNYTHENTLTEIIKIDQAIVNQPPAVMTINSII